jgi:cell division protein FtsI/penicillin-binding protein 2
MLTSNDSIKIRIKLVAGMAVICFCLLAVKLYQVQIERHEELYEKAKKQYTTVKTTHGTRGEIFDINGNLLVGNVPCADIIADPQIVGDEPLCSKAARIFANRLEEPYAEFHARLSQKYRIRKKADGSTEKVKNRFVVVAGNVPFQEAEELKKAIKLNNIKGVIFKDTYRRFYTKNTLLSNILGFTTVDQGKYIPQIGVEKTFDKQMESSDAIETYERSRDGSPLSYGFQEADKVKNGFNIYLTISEPLQSILEEELDGLVAKWRPKAAYAIMVDPKTGNVLAIAQRPSFNPNERKTISPDNWRIRITEDVFEPGSTMKPVAISGALDYGVITPNTMFNCENGSWFYAGKILRDSHRIGTVPAYEVVQKSSNIGTAKIAIMLGEQRLHLVLRKFGFGASTGIPVTPETRGIFRPLNKWDKLSISRFPIGQGIGVSPIQLVRAYCALANKGNLRTIRLIDRIENTETGVVIKKSIPEPFQVFNNPDTPGKIVNMMSLVTKKGGTATAAAIPGFNVAGKTGTSQKFINGQYSHANFFSSFIGFVPAEDPAFVLLVTVDEPRGSYYGGAVAAPYFKNISLRALRYLDIKPDPKLLEQEEKDKNSKDEISQRD